MIPYPFWEVILQLFSLVLTKEKNPGKGREKKGIWRKSRRMLYLYCLSTMIFFSELSNRGQFTHGRVKHLDSSNLGSKPYSLRLQWNHCSGHIHVQHCRCLSWVQGQQKSDEFEISPILFLFIIVANHEAGQNLSCRRWKAMVQGTYSQCDTGKCWCFLEVSLWRVALSCSPPVIFQRGHTINCNIWLCCRSHSVLPPESTDILKTMDTSWSPWAQWSFTRCGTCSSVKDT